MFRKPTMEERDFAVSCLRMSLDSSMRKASELDWGTPHFSLDMICMARSIVAWHALSRLRMSASSSVKLDKAGFLRYSSKALAVALCITATLFITISSDSIGIYDYFSLYLKIEVHGSEGVFFPKGREFIFAVDPLSRPDRLFGIY